MQQNYWSEMDAHVIKKTGKNLSEWIKILDKFKAAEKKSNEVVAYLRQEHRVLGYRAKALTTFYLRKKY